VNLFGKLQLALVKLM